jgi:hypothetical protein
VHSDLLNVQPDPDLDPDLDLDPDPDPDDDDDLNVCFLRFNQALKLIEGKLTIKLKGQEFSLTYKGGRIIGTPITSPQKKENTNHGVIWDEYTRYYTSI